jgi:transcriptional regulator with XRE-family HTH domain
MAQKPFQEWFDLIRAERGWTLHEIARRLGISATTAYQYKEGRILPKPAVQRRLAELTGTPLEVVKQVVWDSRDVDAERGRGAAREPTPEPTRPPELPAPPLKPARVGRRRIRPLGLAFTMYSTHPIPLEYLDRLCLLAAARRSTPAETLRDALRIALPLMEQKVGR